MKRETGDEMAHDQTRRHKKLYIETVGCQMNVLDSEFVAAALRARGYELTDDIRVADVVLFNTCSVRQHAEDKIYSALGRLKARKRRQPELIIGVLGCMAQKDQKRIFHRAPHVDLIAGPGQLHRVPELLEQVERERRQRMAVSLPRTAGSRQRVEASFETFESLDPDRLARYRPARFQAYVRIMMGCDKFCTFCVVPSVRGPEQSRPPQAILEECRRLVDEGCVEITLLGQTVNSYRFRHRDGRITRLSDLLAAVHELPGLKRLKFVTNYPKDMTPDLLEAVRDLPKVSPYLHVPAQSGSDAVLRRMKRGYTVAEYREMVERVREYVPQAALASDFIVGFCGETEADFEATCQLVRWARYKNCFVFKYSPRPGTKAVALYEDDVPEEVKRRRNNELLALQNAIGLEQNRQFIGRTVEVLVEGPSAASRRTADGDVTQLAGRTHDDRIVVFDGNRRLIGSFARVRVSAVTPTTLIGSIETTEGRLPSLAQASGSSN